MSTPPAFPTVQRLLGLTLAVLAVVACGAPEQRTDPARSNLAAGGTPAGPSSGEAPAAQAERQQVAPRPRSGKLDLEFAPGAWSADSAETTSRRVAILIAADRYSQPSWNLPTVERTGQDLRAALVESMQYDERDVILLTGNDVSSDNVQIELERFGKRLTGPGNSLVVWWIGHGFNIQGEQRYLTYGSDGTGSGGYSRTVSHDELRSWIGETRGAVESRGGTLVTALVADACRTDTMSAPTRLRDYRPELDIEAFSAPPGQPAEAGSDAGVTAYTGESVRTMARLKREERVSLVQVLTEASRSLDRTPEQAAQLFRPTDADVLLRNTKNLWLAVRVIDAHTSLPIDGAIIARKNGESFEGAEASFTGLSAAQTGYEFSLAAPGYFTRNPVIPLDVEDSGKTVTFELSRDFVSLRGRVNLLGRGSVIVDVTESFDGFVEGWHSASTTLNRSGTWELWVPNTPGQRSLRFKDGMGVELHSVSFDLADADLRLEKIYRTTVKTLGFDEVSFADGQARVGFADLDVTAIDLGDYQLPWDPNVLGEDDFVNRRAYSFYRRVNGYVANRDFESAGQQLEALLDDNSVKTRDAKQRLETLRHHLEVAHLDESSRDKDREAAIATILSSELRDEEWILARLILLLADSAADHYQARDFEVAVDRLTLAGTLGDRRWSRDTLPEAQVQRLEEVVESLPGRIQQVIVDWRGVARELGERDGEWTASRQVLDAMQQHGEDAEATAEWEDYLEREAVSLNVRQSWSLALDLGEADQLQAALDALQLVLDDTSCNDHYRDQALEERSDLWYRLYARASQNGYELELQGQHEEAFEPYLAAYQIERLERTSLDRLLAKDPGLSTRRADLVERMQAISAAHRAERFRSQAREADRSGRDRDACELLLKAARAYGEAGQHADKAVVSRIRALILDEDLGDIAAAIEAYGDTAQLWAAAERFDEQGHALYNQAYLQLDRDQLAAQRGFEQAAASYARANDSGGEGKALLQLGWAHLPEGGGDDYTAALDALRRAEPLLERAGETLRLGACHHGQFLSRARGQPELAGAGPARSLQAAIHAYRLGGDTRKANQLEQANADVLAQLDV